MRSLPIAIVFLAVAYAISGREIPTGVASKIVGGTNALPGQYPYQVSLRVYFKHFCGGSILNNRWILTAAHCIYTKRPDEVSVIAGTYYLPEAGQMYQAVYKIEHPQYNSFTRANDVGLIYVSRNIVFTDKIGSIALPSSNFDKINYPAVVSGWGAFSLNGPFSNYLQQIKVNVISQEDCAGKQNHVIDSNICTFSKVGGGVCKGDGGNPLVADGVQIGISSFALCAKGGPDVYARVWNFVDWINETMKNKP